MSDIDLNNTASWTKSETAVVRQVVRSAGLTGRFNVTSTNRFILVCLPYVHVSAEVWDAIDSALRPLGIYHDDVKRGVDKRSYIKLTS